MNIIFLGIFEGPSYPSMHALWYCDLCRFVYYRTLKYSRLLTMFVFFFSLSAQWFPVRDRTFLTAISYSGAFVGTIAAFSLSGWLCSLVWLGGWPLTFYVWGASGVLVINNNYNCYIFVFLQLIIITKSLILTILFIEITTKNADYILCSGVSCGN